MQDLADPHGRTSIQRTKSRPLTLTPTLSANASSSASPLHVKPYTKPLSITNSAKASRFSLLHFNDVYNIEARDQEPVGGAARFVHKCKHLIQDHNAIVLFSGDSFNPSLMSTVTKGAQMPPVLNAAGVQAAAVGNHDLDFGLSRFKQLSAQCTFPWLMANLLDRKTSDVFPGCKRFHVIDHHGIRIGLIGLVEHEWLATMPLLEIDNVLYLDFVVEGRRLSRLLREDHGADMVIALTHMRAPNDLHLGAQIDYERIVVDSHVPEDPTIAQLVEAHIQELDKQLDAPAGPTAVPLDGRFVMVRTRECNLGNLIADIALAALNVDPALRVDCTLINSGSLRSDMVHAAGMLRKKDLVNILPMVDEMMVIQASGSVLLRALEVGVSAYPKLEGRFLQVGNIVFSFDPSLPPGRRVVQESVLVGGKPLDLSRLYAVGTKNYLVQGKDGFECLAEVHVPTFNSFAVECMYLYRASLNSRCCLQCPVLRCDEDCQQLALMVSEHFERLQDLNRKLQSGELVSEGADPAIRRLLSLATKTAGNDSSAIIRFFPRQGIYAADPAVEQRITTV